MSKEVKPTDVRVEVEQVDQYERAAQLHKSDELAVLQEHNEDEDEGNDESIGDNSVEDTQQEDEEEDDSDSDSDKVPQFNNKRIILQRFTIYNSKSTMYIVGSNAKESLFRILEINKDEKDETKLTIIEDKSYFYTRKDMVDLINGLNETIEGGISKIAHGYGLLGLIKFTKGYYLSIITKCSQVAIIGGHYIYHIDETKLIPLGINYKRPNKYTDEEKLLSIFKYLDLGKTFYFSYAYDITNSLQTNFIRHKKLATNYQRNGDVRFDDDLYNNFHHNQRFVWNKLLLQPILNHEDIATYEWFQPIIHGFIDQANISIYGKKIYITIIARRSNNFAGARFLKRGVNYDGNVANEIETEQIVTDMLVTPFHDPKYGFFNNPRFTSFVQHRGSIPLYWTQDLNRLPKPPIEINLTDPFYSSSALHFNDLFKRYGSPIIILNLIKCKEKTPRESKLNQHFINCINYLNQFLPQQHKLQFNSFDMSRHSKRNMDVIVPLQKIANDSINQIGFFHNGTSLETTKIQKGIIRTNCIDCLDRTNAAQFIICKEALSYQLSSLGLISENTSLSYDSDLINILTEIFHDHGDTIAIQYGGSNLVNTMDSYRRINQWSSHTRDMINSIKRIYSNSFMDSIRQEAINLFLGNYIYDAKKPKLWELPNDFYLHNTIDIDNIRTKISYIHWFNNNVLNNHQYDMKSLAPIHNITNDWQPFIYERLKAYPDFNDNWFNECYVPRKFQSLTDLFSFNMNSNSRYFPSNLSVNKKFDYSPFQSRKRLKPIAAIENVISTEKTSTNIDDITIDNTIDEKPIKENDEEQELEGEEKLTSLGYKMYDSDIEEEDEEDDEADDKEISFTYLNIPHSKKIKNLLTSGMEKLGYNNHSNHEHPKLHNHKYNNSSLINSETDDDGSPSIHENDKQLYMNHNDLSTYLRKPMNFKNGVELSTFNANTYMKYTQLLNMKEIDFNSLYDVSTYEANRRYLGSNDDGIDIALDNYFR